MFLFWYMHITALGIQLLGLASIISFLEGSLAPCGSRIWTTEWKPDGFPWGVQLCLTAEKESYIFPQEGQAHGQEAAGEAQGAVWPEVQGCSIRRGESSPGETDCLERQVQNPG